MAVRRSLGPAQRGRRTTLDERTAGEMDAQPHHAERVPRPLHDLEPRPPLRLGLAESTCLDQREELVHAVRCGRGDRQLVAERQMVPIRLPADADRFGCPSDGGQCGRSRDRAEHMEAWRRCRQSAPGVPMPPPPDPRPRGSPPRRPATRSAPRRTRRRPLRPALPPAPRRRAGTRGRGCGDAPSRSGPVRCPHGPATVASANAASASSNEPML